MKKFILIFFCLIVHCTLYIENCMSQSGWFQLNSGVTINRNSVFFPASATGNFGYVAGDNGVILKTTTGGSVGINNQSEVIKDFSLEQNYPNPFNPTTKIKFNIAPVGQRHAFDVRLVVYDALGREIATLINAPLQPGTYEVTFDGSNLPGGIYFYILKAGDIFESRKMVLLK